MRSFFSKLNFFVSVGDDFTQRLLKLYETVYQEGITQKIAFGIHRSDYMLHHADETSDDISSDKLLQVEINTISAAFGALSSKTSELHEYGIPTKNISENSSAKLLRVFVN